MRNHDEPHDRHASEAKRGTGLPLSRRHRQYRRAHQFADLCTVIGAERDHEREERNRNGPAAGEIEALQRGQAQLRPRQRDGDRHHQHREKRAGTWMAPLRHSTPAEDRRDHPRGHDGPSAPSPRQNDRRHLDAAIGNENESAERPGVPHAGQFAHHHHIDRQQDQKLGQVAHGSDIGQGRVLEDRVRAQACKANREANERRKRDTHRGELQRVQKPCQ